MKDKKVFLFTATLEDYWSLAFQKVFELDKKCILRFPTGYFVKHKKDLQQKIEVFVHKNKKESIIEVVKLLRQKMKSQPVLVFISKDDADVKSAVKQAVGKQVPFNIIEDEEAAMTIGIEAEQFTKGVFVMKEAFSHGFDLKFGCASYVIVFSEDFYFKSSTIRQMIGRANRTQGVQSGAVFTTAANVMSNVMPFTNYDIKVTQRHDTFGPFAARGCVLAYKNGNVAMKKKIVKVFGGNLWQRTRDEIDADLGQAKKFVDPLYK